MCDAAEMTSWSTVSCWNINVIINELFKLFNKVIIKCEDLMLSSLNWIFLGMSPRAAGKQWCASFFLKLFNYLMEGWYQFLFSVRSLERLIPDMLAWHRDWRCGETVRGVSRSPIYMICLFTCKLHAVIGNTYFLLRVGGSVNPCKPETYVVCSHLGNTRCWWTVNASKM